MWQRAGTCLLRLVGIKKAIGSQEQVILLTWLFDNQEVWLPQ